MKSTSAIFAEGAIGLLRRALADGLCLDITVNATEARAVLADARGTELARETRGGQLALPLAPAAVPAPVEPPVPAVDPVAPGHRVMRAGDLVVERISGGATRDWVVESVDKDGPTLRRSDRPGATQAVKWGHITLDSADLWRLASPWDRPGVGDRIELDGVAVEVMGVDDEGFIWRTVEAGDDRDEGEALWADVLPFAVGVWVTRDPEAVEAPAVEAAPPAKKTRAKKARAPKVASTEPAAPVPHRLQAVTEADELAHRGEHSLIGLRGGEWLTLATRASAETLPEWHLRCTTASKAVRVRVYDRGAHCTWDSLDGNEGHIQGNP
jgi:hypothetical protein